MRGGEGGGVKRLGGRFQPVGEPVTSHKAVNKATAAQETKPTYTNCIKAKATRREPVVKKVTACHFDIKNAIRST